jgi:hypothetical protein
VTGSWAPELNHGEPNRAAANEGVGDSMVTRVAGWAIGLALGILFGALGTIVSQSTVELGTIPVPIGLIVALPAIALLLVGLRSVLRNRIGAILAAVGMVGVVFVLSQPSTGGSVLVPANTAGYVWTFAPTLIAVVVLAWPRRQHV